MATGLTVLMALALGPALAGTASAAPLTTAAATPSSQWAYGGQGWDNGSITQGNATLNWTSWFAWDVIFTSTATGPNTVALEAQRSVGMSVVANYASPALHATYKFHAAEADTAFANLTNGSTVYVNGTPVPALGINNASAHANASVAESFVVSNAMGVSHSAWLNVSAAAQSSVSFSPALGLIPLNLSGVHHWNSTAMANPAASWSIHYDWANLGLGGASGSGSGSENGSLSASGVVTLNGFTVDLVPDFHDHESRDAVVLIISGPLDDYDGFILIPHDFDLFGGASHRFDGDAAGSAAISAQTLYVSEGRNGLEPTAAATTFGTSDTAMGGLGTSVSGVAPAAGPAPGQTVLGSPISVAQAQGESNCIEHGCSAASSGTTSAMLGVALIALAVVAVVGAVAVIEWRSYARRKSQKGLVGSYSESWTNGVPPAGALQAPAAPANAPAGPEENLRRP